MRSAKNLLLVDEALSLAANGAILGAFKVAHRIESPDVRDDTLMLILRAAVHQRRYDSALEIADAFPTTIKSKAFAEVAYIVSNQTGDTSEREKVLKTSLQKAESAIKECPRPENQLDTYEKLLIVYAKMGEKEKAVAAALRAKDAALKLLAEDENNLLTTGIVEVLVGISLRLLFYGYKEEALSIFEEAMKVAVDASLGDTYFYHIVQTCLWENAPELAKRAAFHIQDDKLREAALETLP